MLMRCAPFVLNLAGFYAIGLYEDVVLTAGFGLGLSCFFFFNLVFTYINGEASGMLIAKNFAIKKYRIMRLNYYRGLIVNIIVLIFSLCCYVKLDSILVGIGFKYSVSIVAREMVVWMIPGLILQAYTEN